MSSRGLVFALRTLFALVVLVTTTAATPVPPAMPVVAPTPDSAGATKFWQILQQADYPNTWRTAPGKGRFYQGQLPHETLLTTYLNGEAARELSANTGKMPDGSIVVKESYTADKALVGFSVMSKQAGYDPAHGDWFWAAFGPDGSVQMAGQVPYCYSCHEAAQSNDYIFTFAHAFSNATPAPFGAPQPGQPSDTDRAAKLWQLLQSADYRDNWPTAPGKGKMYRGQPPHGVFLTTYLNKEAVDGLAAKTGQMPDGALIVKDNFALDKSMTAITVMAKESGYDPGNNDWFWATFNADGTLRMAGRLPNCYVCHAALKSNDYIFTFPIAVGHMPPISAPVGATPTAAGK